MDRINPVQRKTKARKTSAMRGINNPRKKIYQPQLAESNDNTVVSTKSGYNQHLADRAISGAKQMGAWRTKHPIYAEISDALSAAPFYLNPVAFEFPLLYKIAGGALGGRAQEIRYNNPVTNKINEYTGLDLPAGTAGGVIGAAAFPWIAAYGE